jgi:hypothetical protein
MELDMYLLRKKINSFPVTNRYEYKNILDRMMINLFNKDPNAFIKAKSECIEKQLDPLNIDRSEKLLKELSHDSDKKLMLPDKETLEMYAFLKNRFPVMPKEDLYKCVLRYAALGMGGQQWRLYSPILDQIKEQTGIDTEAFASPFNRHFPKYYSLFKDDAKFGSLGNFLQTKHAKTEALYINPPFTPYVLSKLPEIVKDLNKCIIITPTWSDAEWYQELEKIPGMQKKLKSHTKYSILDKDFIPSFVTTLWTKGVTFQLP